jgi:hypothetical protein
MHSPFPQVPGTFRRSERSPEDSTYWYARLNGNQHVHECEQPSGCTSFRKQMGRPASRLRFCPA